jgi:hypothetical protein
MEKKWYEYGLKERYEKIYSKYSIKEFFKWWIGDDEDSFMEIRYDDWKIVKFCNESLNFINNKNSLFINKDWQLEKLIKISRDKSTLWFGINPRRFLPHIGISGKDININKLKFLFVDIDRVESNKNGPATNEDLMNADFLANQLLEELGKAGFNKNYVKICSGNGLQLLIKLDVPINIPKPIYNEERGVYSEEQNFIDAKQIIQKGIGKILPTFSNKFKEDYKVEIDKTGFNIGRVGALPYSFNRKYEKHLPRGIVEFKTNEENIGFSDYLNNIYEDSSSRTKVSSSFKTKTPIVMSEEYKIINNELSKNMIVDLMLNYKFPNGGINNTLWYGIKILLHSNGINNRSEEYIKIHHLLMSIHNRSFSENGLEERYTNNDDGPLKISDINIVPGMINKYLRFNKIQSIKDNIVAYHKPIFPVSPNGKKKQKITIDIHPRLINKKSNYIYKINDIKEDPLKDIKDATNELFNIRRGDNIDLEFKEKDFIYNNVGEIIVKQQIEEFLIEFLKEYRKKWGNEITIYMMKYYMNDYFNYIRF